MLKGTTPVLALRGPGILLSPVWEAASLDCRFVCTCSGAFVLHGGLTSKDREGIGLARKNLVCLSVRHPGR